MNWFIEGACFPEIRIEIWIIMEGSQRNAILENPEFWLLTTISNLGYEPKNFSTLKAKFHSQKPAKRNEQVMMELVTSKHSCARQEFYSWTWFIEGVATQKFGSTSDEVWNLTKECNPGD